MQKLIEKLKQSEFKNWSNLAKFLNKNPKNFHRTLNQYIEKVNLWLKPVKLRLTVEDITDVNIET